MPWNGRERRLQPRPVGNPTYIVEKDAPPWEPPMPFWQRWRRGAIDFVKRTRYDAYPDHELPFEDMLRQLPIVAPKKPRPRHGEVHLMVVGRQNARLVPLAGTSIDKINMTKRMIQGWLAYEITTTVDKVIAYDEERNKGQSLAEYALLLALIAIVAIIALVFLGGQIVQVFEDLGGAIPAGSSPAP